jgi:serine/threonine protein kinase
MDEKDEFSNIIIFNKYLTSKKLGEGSFGLVYSGTNIQTKDKVAIKLVCFIFYNRKIKKKELIY